MVAVPALIPLILPMPGPAPETVTIPGFVLVQEAKLVSVTLIDPVFPAQILRDPELSDK